MSNQNIKGASDLYNLMVEVKNGTRGCIVFSKKECKALNMTWGFVEKSALVLGLTINKAGVHGFNISK